MGELFCGPGGLALGASMASAYAPDGAKLVIRHAWATDYDPDACNTYRANIPGATPNSVICADIRMLDMQHLTSISPIDGLTFGFPCNDFSVVGEQRGLRGDYGPLYAYGLVALRLFQPLWFVAENVGGIRSANAGTALSGILEGLYECGYSVYPHLYSFDQYGVPQRRQRLIIVGIRGDQENVAFRVPSPAPFSQIDVSAKTAIESPPIPPDAPNHEFTRQDPRVVQRLKYVAPGQNAFQAELPAELALNVRGARISQIYRRLHPERPAYTVTGSGGGGTHVYHWREPRALTNRERARLQTFPDTFVFAGGKESVRRQIGMAVPCVAAKHVFTALLHTLAGVPYPSVDSSIAPLLQPAHVAAYNEHRGTRDLRLFECGPQYGGA
jgi:DNA (cytosine-5)-methyltransferase 1